MFEMAESGHCHCHTVGIAVFDGFLISDGTAGLDYRVHTGLMCYFHAIREGEECVTGHDCAFEIEAE